jgi:uncharacterized membrane protein
MSLDPTTVLTILGMALLTYATRVGGLALGGARLTGRMRAAFEAIPAAVLTAVIAPSALATGWRETLAAAIVCLAATRLPLLAVVAIGVAVIVALRAL